MNEKNHTKTKKQKKVQGIYREIKRQQQEDVAEAGSTFGNIIVNICVVIILFFFVMSTLFDLGVQVPRFFGY
ncbi:hypothetical protein [Niallia taxi]|uniref:hypothetical protein n=1 Tax=Niallia taxi TaxID=2499688 RepID=UPI00300AAB44